MKELDETKEYYLGNLNEEQRGILYDYLLSVDDTYKKVEKIHFQKRDNDYLCFLFDEWIWSRIKETNLITDALELFEDEPNVFDKLKGAGLDLDNIVNEINRRIAVTTYNEYQSNENIKPNLRIGETFECNGFICEVKEKIEEKKWYVVDRGIDTYYTTLAEEAVLWERAKEIRVEEITDQEFISQLEKYSK